MNPDTRVSRPITDLMTGVMQMSITPDGSRMAVNTISEGLLDVFVVQEPLERVKSSSLEPNHWAERRAREREAERVPAIGYSRALFNSEFRSDGLAVADPDALTEEEQEEQEVRERQTDTIDFRNYEFSEDLEEEYADDEREERFSPEENRTDDGRFIPRRYRLNFTPDFTQGQASIGTRYATYSAIQARVSDVLGDHQISFGSNLVFDLRNSSYFLQYAYLRNRTNYFGTFTHNAIQFQTFSGDIVRFRYYSGDVGISYPLNRFERFELSGGFVGLSRDLTNIQFGARSTVQRDYLLYPQARYVRDVTIPGFITPAKGSRLALELSGSAPVSDAFLGFVSATADARYYVNLGRRYTIAMRGLGGASFGPDPQNYLLGGVSGWINFQQQQRLSQENLANIFFALPALPMRGWAYNSSVGDKFALTNFEFRFPLIAAAIPGPIPLFPLYNIQGVGFVDVGASWEGEDFNDLLVGTGFGLRTILFGLPFRYDLAWPYSEDIHGGFGPRVHYFSIGIDF
jgi:hypothetical protein